MSKVCGCTFSLCVCDRCDLQDISTGDLDDSFTQGVSKVRGCTLLFVCMCDLCYLQDISAGDADDGSFMQGVSKVRGCTLSLFVCM